MISPWVVYFVMMPDNIITVFQILFAVFLFLTFTGFIFVTTEEKDKERAMLSLKNDTKKLLIAAFFGLIALFIPTTNQMAAILLIPKMANSDFAQQASKLPVDLTKLAEKYILDKLSEDKDNKNK